MLMSPEFWVFAAFLILVGVLVYYRVPQALVGLLDDRSQRIKAELDEARRLKDEAQKLLVAYQRRRHEAEGEAEAIVAAARAEAERLAEETKQKMEEFVARRTKLAETKIAQAEAQALADVRTAAAEAAVGAAEHILRDAAKGPLAEDLIAQGLRQVRSKLN